MVLARQTCPSLSAPPLGPWTGTRHPIRLLLVPCPGGRGWRLGSGGVSATRLFLDLLLGPLCLALAAFLAELQVLLDLILLLLALLIGARDEPGGGLAAAESESHAEPERPEQPPRR